MKYYFDITTLISGFSHRPLAVRESSSVASSVVPQIPDKVSYSSQTCAWRLTAK